MPAHITTERDTRRERVDPRLQEAGWRVISSGLGMAPADGCALREYPTANGPADYALWLDGRVAAVVEAKKLTLGPQNVLTQAERYARGLHGNGPEYNGLYVPFIYSTNGEVIWFHDVRPPCAVRRSVQVHSSLFGGRRPNLEFFSRKPGLTIDELPGLRCFRPAGNDSGWRTSAT